MAPIEVGTLLASRSVVVSIRDGEWVSLTPGEAIDLANRLTEAVEQIDGRS